MSSNLRSIDELTRRVSSKIATAIMVVVAIAIYPTVKLLPLLCV